MPFIGLVFVRPMLAIRLVAIGRMPGSAIVMKVRVPERRVSKGRMPVALVLVMGPF